ncbi:MAG: S1C family serine protease [Verrucomicrobiaceae bacterium]
MTKWIFAAVIFAGGLEGRPYFNDQKAPESLEDLANIQKSLQANLAKTRAATVCLEIGEGSGSGVIISEDGLVLTAAHVSGGVDNDITVVLEDGRKLKGVSLGLNSETDAAMLQITDPGPFPYVEVDREDSFKLGDWVFALGHSGGFDEARGVNVRVGRIVRQADSTVQSDCVLIGGDSGGPLFDIEGNLIAIHSRVGASKEESMHVPLREFQRKWDEMLNSEFVGEGAFAQKGEPGSGFFGVKVESAEGGLRVTEVFPESVAAEAGLKEGDLLEEFDGVELGSEEALYEALEKRGSGESVSFRWKRGEEVTESKVKLAERP